MLINGVQVVSIKDELEDFQSQARSFLYIFQGFMGLGLIVGLAAIGVIAFRAVVERRQQIGVLRAIGFQSRAVSLSFLIETAFIVLLGCLSGTILGLLLARNLFAGDSFIEGGVSLVGSVGIDHRDPGADGDRGLADDADPCTAGVEAFSGRSPAIRVAL